MVFDPVTGTTIGGGSDPTPGGACDGDCNVISGNGADGIAANGHVLDTSIRGNYIGTDIDGAAAVPNGGYGAQLAGFRLDAGDSLGSVGTAAAPNVISGNAGSGLRVSMEQPSSLAIRSNLIGTAADGTSPLGNGGSGVELAGRRRRRRPA